MLNRHVIKELKELSKIMPVILITGARQSGKTTLLESLSRPRAMVTFDDPMTLGQAKSDPVGWLKSLPKPIMIDEVQRVPEIFLPIKRDVDQNRHPGRYILTGSANPLLLPKMGDSLAGRMGIINLYPFSQGELCQKQEKFIPYIFGDEFKQKSFEEVGGLYDLFLKGGFPPVQKLKTFADVNRWIRAYLQTMLDRDVRDIANVEGLRDFPRLFRLVATRSGNLLNIADLSRSMGMVNMTINRYLKLLEALYFVTLLPAWFTNKGKRLTKSPKAFLCDTALLSSLLEVDKKRLESSPTLAGQFLENFVFAELLKQKTWAPFQTELYHFRDGRFEVDFVLERPSGDIVGIEVKSAVSLQSNDLKGLKHLKQMANHNFKRGIILHRGSSIQRLEEDIWAMPIQSLWQL